MQLEIQQREHGDSRVRFLGPAFAEIEAHKTVFVSGVRVDLLLEVGRAVVFYECLPDWSTERGDACAGKDGASESMAWGKVLERFLIIFAVFLWGIVIVDRGYG